MTDHAETSAPLTTQPLHRAAGRIFALDAFQRALIGLVLLRIIVALIFLLDILPLDLRQGIYLHHGGDQFEMMTLARSLLRGRPNSSVVGLGQPLVMAFWLRVLRLPNPDYYTDLVVPLVIINGFVLGGLSVALVGMIAKRTLNDAKMALGAAAIWALLPFFTYFAFFWHFDPVLLRASNVPKLGWLNGLSDAPAVFALLMMVAVLVQASPQHNNPSFWRMLVVGLMGGITILFRVHLATAVLFVLIYIVFVHGWQAMMVALGGTLIAYLPQAWYNQLLFGFPLTTGYISSEDALTHGGLTSRPLNDIIESLPFRPENIIETLGYVFGRRPWIAVPVLIVLIATGVAIVLLRRRHGGAVAAILAGTPLAYLLPMAFTGPFSEDILRFSIPAMPFLTILGIAVAFEASRIIIIRYSETERH